MSNQKDRIVLSYNLKSTSADYQGVFYGHLVGSTLAIGAKFKVVKENQGLIQVVNADFISKTMGGVVNLALYSVESTITHDVNESPRSTKYHVLKLKLAIVTGTDVAFDPIDLTFEEDFNPKTDILRIEFDLEKDIHNLKKGMLHESISPVDDYHSCDIVVDPGT